MMAASPDLATRCEKTPAIPSAAPTLHGSLFPSFSKRYAAPSVGLAMINVIPDWHRSGSGTGHRTLPRSGFRSRVRARIVDRSNVCTAGKISGRIVSRFTETKMTRPYRIARDRYGTELTAKSSCGTHWSPLLKRQCHVVANENERRSVPPACRFVMNSHDYQGSPSFHGRPKFGRWVNRTAEKSTRIYTD